MTIKDQLRRDLEKSIAKAFGVELDAEVTRTVDPKMGDYATNAALKISGIVKHSPQESAKLLSDNKLVFSILY